MSKSIDCQVFQDQLDALKQGALSPEGVEQLHSHARSCPDCDGILRMHDQLILSSQTDLESAVPDEWVSGMWPRVREAIAEKETLRSWRLSRWTTWRWLVPTLAAAGVVLLVSSGLLYAQLMQLKRQERALSQQLARQEMLLDEMSARTSYAGMEAGTLDRRAGLAAGRRLQRALSGRERVTLGELSELIAGLSPDVEILDAAGARTVIRRMPPWRTAALRECIAGIQMEDGLQATEALHLIKALDLDPAVSISTDRLVSISSGLLRAETPMRRSSRSS